MWGVALVSGVVAALFGLYLLWNRIAFAPPARWSERRVQFLGAGTQVKGDFGELLTAAVLTQEGWRQLPSKADANGRGIDGLFFRPHWLTGLRVLVTETKVNASPFKLHQLSNTKLIRALGDLYVVGVLDDATARAIIRGLKRRAVRKEHWHHNLHSGWTAVQRADRHGRLIGRIRKRDTAALMESLTMMIGAMDRSGQYMES